MMLRKTIYILLICLLAACKPDIYSEKAVGKVAKQYYSYLLHGDYAAYVASTYRSTPLRESDAEELIDNLKMFIAAQDAAKEGIKSVDVQSANIDKELGTAEVRLALTYGNGEQEVVLLPLILHDGLWYLR